MFHFFPQQVPLPRELHAAEDPRHRELGPLDAHDLPRPAAADAARGADGFTEREREALRIVNAEYERSQQGGWRRLFPSPRSKEYTSYLDPARQLHHLPFTV